MEGGPPMFNPGFPSPSLLVGWPVHDYRAFTFCGASFKRFVRFLVCPLSIASTHGIAVAFFSCSY